MAIQNRRGQYADFDPTKAVAGEMLVVQQGDPNATDGKAVYMAFSSGSVKRLATYEDMVENIEEATEDVAQDVAEQIEENLQLLVTTAQTAAQTATTKANEASQSASSVSASAAQIETNKNDISDLKSALSSLADDFIEFDHTFIRGGLTNQGAINSETHRIVSENIVSYPYPLFIKVMDDDYRFKVCIYNNDGSFNCLYDFYLDYLYVPANTKLRIVIAKRTESAVPADIGLFMTKVMMQTYKSFDLENILSLYNRSVFDGHLKKQFQCKYYSNGAFVFGGYRSIAETQIFPFDVKISNVNGSLYHFNVKLFTADSPVGANYKGTSGWLTTNYIIPKNTYWTIEFTRISSSTPLPSNLEMASLINFEGIDMIPDLDVQDVENSLATLNYWNISAESYSDYLKRYMAHDMVHKYYTNGSIIDAPKYYCHVAIHSLPVGVTVDFDDAEFKVHFFRKDGDTGSDYINWSASPKYIPRNTYFMISAQYSTAISLDDWYEKFNVIADCDIVNLNSVALPSKSYGSRWSVPARFQLLWFSDIHADQERLKRIVDYVGANGENISDAICTGDMVSNQYSDDYTFWSTCGAGNILTVIGNHDALVGTNPLTWATNAQIYEKYFSPYIDNWGVTYEANSCNWYKIYNNNVILVGLCATNSTAEEESAMVDFLTSALNTAKTNGYAVIIAHHYPSNPLYTSNYETSFETPGYVPVDLFIPESVFSAVKAFKNNGGEFVCYITGHTHSDLARYRTEDNQIVLTVSTAFLNAGIQQNAQFREPFTKYQDLFNILYVDTAKKIVSIKRIGSDMDVWLRRLDYLSINYETGELI